jgi:hypothetical protein
MLKFKDLGRYAQLGVGWRIVIKYFVTIYRVIIF